MIHYTAAHPEGEHVGPRRAVTRSEGSQVKGASAGVAYKPGQMLPMLEPHPHKRTDGFWAKVNRHAPPPSGD